MILRAGQYAFCFPRPTLVMGVVNATPDSFSDGNEYLVAERAVAHGLELAAQGAEILDIGGESTRPGAAMVDEIEELRRVIPVIEALRARTNVLLSVDTMKPAVARAAIAAGAGLVNDVGANRSEAEMWRIVAETGCGYVCMHMQGSPQTMQVDPQYADVVQAVGDFFEDRLRLMRRSGVALEQIALDVGIGFGKTVDHNLQLLGALRSFTKLERPILVGVSRKSFIGKVTGASVTERLGGSIAGATLAVEAGANILRVHDVTQTVQAVRLAEAILAHKQR